MENLIIEASKYTPEINFDCQKHILVIKGSSYPENVMTFYDPIFSWLKDYLAQVSDETVSVTVDLVYFNSSSSKTLMNFFDLLDDAAGDGKNIIINWIYESDDEDALEFGEDFEEDLENVTFNLVEK